jgi:hypothetical protein
MQFSPPTFQAMVYVTNDVSDWPEVVASWLTVGPVSYLRWPIFKIPSSKRDSCLRFVIYFLQATPLRYFVRPRILTSTYFVIITHPSLLMMDRDSSVGIATCYWLDGLGFGSRLPRHFLHPSGLALRPTQPPVQRVQDPVVERLGRGVGHPPHPASKLKKV